MSKEDDSTLPLFVVLDSETFNVVCLRGTNNKESLIQDTLYTHTYTHTHIYTHIHPHRCTSIHTLYMYVHIPVCVYCHFPLSYCKQYNDDRIVTSHIHNLRDNFVSSYQIKHL